MNLKEFDDKLHEIGLNTQLVGQPYHEAIQAAVKEFLAGKVSAPADTK